MSRALCSRELVYRFIVEICSRECLFGLYIVLGATLFVMVMVEMVVGQTCPFGFNPTIVNVSFSVV